MKKNTPLKEDYTSPESQTTFFLSNKLLCVSGEADNFVVDPEDDIEF